MDDYVMVELNRMGGKGYGVVLWEDEESKYLSDVIESGVKEGRFVIIQRMILEDRTKSFGDPIDPRDGAKLDALLYKKAKEIAIEKSRLQGILLVDNTGNI